MQNPHKFEVKSQLNFKSQGIQIDFLAFEFDQSSFNRESLIDYFFHLGFNAFEHTGYNKHKNWVALLEKSTHKHQIVFRQPNVVRDWRLLHFSGGNAHRFYALVKQNRIDWNVFAGSKLTRLDTAYSRSIKTSEPPIEDFFIETEKRILESPYHKAQDFKFENNEKGLIIRIGNRKHIHYLRIYKKRENPHLRFEHEFKSKPRLNNLFNLLKSEMLQTQATIQFFHEKNFKSISAIPLANVSESLEVGQPLIATVWVSEPLFRYKFPFSLPKFSTNTTKLPTRVWAYWIQQFATKDIKKVFNISEFFQNYPAQLNSKQKQVIKNEFLKAVEYYSKVQLIDQKFQIIGEELRKGFIGLALRNEELLKLNEQLNQQLAEVLTELNIIKQEREQKAARKKAWANRTRLPKRDPINNEIYKLLIQESEGPSYVATRTRVAICLITVTGVRISELLPLKVNQLQTLLKEGWVSIDRLKRGPANHKAFLNKEGKRIVKARQRDFDALFLMKEKDSYVFTSDRNPNQMLQRQTLTTDVNKVTKALSQSLPGKPNITSHSFRIGYITQLWKDTKDIEFVKQTIGHRKLDTTSAYVNQLSDQERQKRIDQLE